MNSILRAKLFRLSRSGVLLLALLVLLGCDVFFSSRSKITENNMYALPELCTMGEYLSYCEASTVSVTSAKNMFIKRGAFAESAAVDLIGVFQDVHPFQFRWVLAGNKGLLMLPIIFVLVFLARDFSGKGFYNSIYAGKRRSQLFFAQTIYYFAVCFVISLLGILCLTGIYAPTVFARLPAGYVISRLLLHALADCALMALPFLAGYLTRSSYLTGAISVVYCVLLRFTGLIWPAAVKGNIAMWEQGANVLPLLLSSIVFLAVSIGASWLLFRRADLK